MQKFGRCLKLSQISPGPEFSLFIKGIKVKKKKMCSSPSVLMGYIADFHTHCLFVVSSLGWVVGAIKSC
jgi:hypothetical protein